MRNGTDSCGYVPAVELDDDLAGAVVIDLLELANVTWKKKRVSMLRRIKSRQILEKSHNSALKTCKIFTNQYIGHLKGRRRRLLRPAA